RLLLLLFFFLSLCRPPPQATPFPYTTLFRSLPLARSSSSKEYRCYNRRRSISRNLDFPIWCSRYYHHRSGEPVREKTLSTSYQIDRKSTRLNSSHVSISYAVFCLKKKKNNNN